MLSEGYFGVDDGLEEDLLKENNNQPKRGERRKEREVYRTMLMDGTAIDIDCANPLVVADN